ncbi:brr2 [Candida metapsilosis]|uniref:Brr2 n=1 Tax=Candida metapsilosis TaxID=273372 RepID=A0A8H8DDL5_9ASCO|nr:brr2 [Candida metapsilosis]
MSDYNETYDVFLNRIRNHLLDASPEIINSAVEILLDILGSDISVATKRKEANELLSVTIGDEELGELINLANDYKAALSKHRGSKDDTSTIAIEVESGDELEDESEEEEEATEPIIDRVYDWNIFKEEPEADAIYEALRDRSLADEDITKRFPNLKAQVLPNRWRIVYSKTIIHNKAQTITDMQKHHPDGLILELLGKKDEQTIKQLQRRLLYEEKSGDDIKVTLPKGTYQEKLPNYDIITVPPSAAPSTDDELLPVSKLPPWAQEAFPSNETSTFNRIQSKIYPMAFESDENLLICAPTGAGKTNVAMLTILRTIENYRINNHIDGKKFKVVYIAPLKALVQEQMREFQRRLTSAYGLVVNELTGDSTLSQQQISETNVIVTTPEKWDIITRKDHDYLKLVKLLIIDEIHLLHDLRGPVLEGIVSRVVRTGDDIRIVGLSATLPNYLDVAKFIRASESGVFYFDASYRPCPLEQKFVGIKEQKALKKKIAMNEACFEQTSNVLKRDQQLIVFVHSRNETAATAQYLVEALSNSDTEVITQVSTREILSQESDRVSNTKLQKLLVYGIGVHHAGLNKEDRTLVEDLFAQGHLKVLVSTATLAWGVNLPAHTVIIKGTEVYSPESGNWTQLSPQDVFQMLGRAGRPRYDKNGEGIIITSQDRIQYYLAILNQQYPIESQLMTKLIDNVNAEVVAGTISSLSDGIDWLGYTYLYVRMLQSPKLYGADSLTNNEDPTMYVRRLELIHAAFTVLHENKLLVLDEGKVVPTELGRIASYHYISYQTVAKYNRLLKPWHTEGDIIRVFAHSDEFQFIPVRREERLEINKLMEKCPIPIKELPTEPLAKINILLQTYISRLGLEGYALISDMIYIKQSASRLLHALYEIALLKKWSSLSKGILDLSKMVNNRLWASDSPLRQFGSLAPKAIIKASESSHLPWLQYFHLTTAELAEVLNLRGNAQQAWDLVHSFPRVELNYTIQTLTEEYVRLKVEATPKWNWLSIHGRQESFDVFLEDCDGNELIQYRHFQVRKEDIDQPHILEFQFKLKSPRPPNLLLSFVSTKWVNCTSKIPILTDLITPKDKSHFVERGENIELKELEGEEIASELYDAICDDENVLIGISPGVQKSLCSDLCIDQHKHRSNKRIVYINPNETTAEAKFKKWSKVESKVCQLSGDLKKDVKAFNSNEVIISSPGPFYSLCKRWKSSKAIKTVQLIVLDDLHELEANPVYEFLITKIKILQSHGEDINVRLVGISYPLLNARDVASWLNVSKGNIINYPASTRDNNIEEIHFSEDKKWSITNRTVLFAGTNSEAVSIAQNLPKRKLKNLDYAIENKLLKESLENGVALLLNEFSRKDKLIVLNLYKAGIVHSLVTTRDAAHLAPSADHVIIEGTQYYDGYEHRDVDYTITDLYNMVGHCQSSPGYIYTHAKDEATEFYSSFINSGIPLESSLDSTIYEFFIDGIAHGLLKSRQDCIDLLTYSFFYKRLLSNPSYYGLKNLSSVAVSEYLSNLIEDLMDDLIKGEFVEDDEEITPSNKALITSHYDLSFETLNTLSTLNGKSKLKDILLALTNAAEFESIPMRRSDELLTAIARKMPLKSASTMTPFYKSFLLIQAFISRVNLPFELKYDQEKVLKIFVRVLNASIDVLSGEGHLSAMLAMDLWQMVSQQVWSFENHLKQVPKFSEEILKRCKEHNVETVYDIMSVEDDERDEILQLEDDDLNEVAMFVNSYPNVKLSFEVLGEESIKVTLERDEELDSLDAVCRLPFTKEENWWVVIGSPSLNQLYAIKKTQVRNLEQTLQMDFESPDSVEDLTCWAICDAYLDADKEVQIS